MPSTVNNKMYSPHDNDLQSSSFGSSTSMHFEELACSLIAPLSMTNTFEGNCQERARTPPMQLVLSTSWRKSTLLALILRTWHVRSAIFPSALPQ